jgi:hypothetical protein
MEVPQQTVVGSKFNTQEPQPQHPVSQHNNETYKLHSGITCFELAYFHLSLLNINYFMYCPTELHASVI